MKAEINMKYVSIRMVEWRLDRDGDSTGDVSLIKFINKCHVLMRTSEQYLHVPARRLLLEFDPLNSTYKK